MKLYRQLEYYLKDVLLNNDSNKLPYHNLNHTLCVLKNCYYLSLEYTIDPDDKRLLCIAALYHDFGHSGGLFTDDWNVKAAIEHFENISKENPEDTSLVMQIIKASFLFLFSFLI